MADHAVDAWHRVQSGCLLVVELGHDVDLGLGSQRRRRREQVRPGGERAAGYDGRLGAESAAVVEFGFRPCAGGVQGLDGARGDRGAVALRRLHGKGDVAAWAEVPGGRLVQDRLVRAEPDHGEVGAYRVRGQGPDIRAAVLAELGGNAEVAGAVAGRCGQRPARRDQRRVQLGHAVAGTPVQLGPH